MANGKRLLILDILRIEAILLIVAYHFSGWYKIYPFYLEGPVLGVWWLSLGQVGVYLFIFVSGAALAYNYPTCRVFTGLRRFYCSRLLRIYPAFWVAIIVAIILTPSIVSKINAENILPVITGFTTWAGLWSGPVAGGFWFIGLIVSLYLLYPVMIRMFEWDPDIAMYAMIAISIAASLLLVMFDFMGASDPHAGVTRWFPLCNVAVFGAGIYCIRKNAYPDTSVDIRAIAILADMTFFIYLYNHMIVERFYPLNIVACLVLVFLVSAGAMLLDWEIKGMSPMITCNTT
jgi:peptidoglycan/LPS O-acetylase OafA/YrhL